jgi:hypothetical protein
MARSILEPAITLTIVIPSLHSADRDTRALIQITDIGLSIHTVGQQHIVFPLTMTAAGLPRMLFSDRAFNGKGGHEL